MALNVCVQAIFSHAGHQTGVTDDADPSLGSQSCPAGAEPPGRKQGADTFHQG